ncbi:hypothetical protein H2202_000157 [Exophiala xenobiotica]|nr:hypothetical protein H2202_000157 [Exophiala xenobiotica]KAK5236876.1 hypothetical protein LTR47_002054 [Exophiala xenobiotica]KAK5250913.1 hypothetical protein LTS06_004432 [Exophiala xenobiotica]KAK5356436.1 hypothetical protein LTR61_000171 [Exophiala xenobiotica]KAK5370905.1 hypothetical protein LTS03_007269 [Exophiala xenobiotica]
MPQTSSNACSRPASAHVSAHFQTSNTTSQYFLGGSTRSWMTNSQTTRVPVARAHGPQETWDGSQRPGGTPAAQTSTSAPVTQTPPTQQVRSQAAQIPHPGLQSPTAARSTIGIVQQNGTLRLPAIRPSVVEIRPTERQTTSFATVAAPIPPSAPLSDAAMPSPYVTSTPGERTRKRPKISGLGKDMVAHSSMRTAPVSGSTITSPQLPTPLDSPIESDADLLCRRLETALAPLANRSLTVDQSPVMDEWRITMLRDACRLNDNFFLVVHLICCAWSPHQGTLSWQLGLTPTQEQGLLSLQQQILGFHRQLSIELGSILYTFPGPPEQLLASGSRLVNFVEPVKEFLRRMAENFPIASEYWINRQWPPCPVELKFALLLPSIVLQRLFFLRFLQRFGSDNDWTVRASYLFESALEEPDQSPVPMNELTLDQIRVPALQFGERYKTLRSLHSGQHHTQPPDRSAQPRPVDFQGRAPAYPYPAQQPSVASPVPQGRPISQQNPANWPHHVIPSNTPTAYHSASSMRLPPIVPSRPSITGHAPVVTVSVPYTATAQASRPPAITYYTGQMPSGSLSQPIANSRMMQTNLPAPQSIPSTAVQRQVENDLLIPRNPILSILAIPDPRHRALHQAHLCSPDFEKLDADTQANGKWYHYVEDVVRLRPLLDAEAPMGQWKLEIPECFWARKALSQKVGREFSVNRRRIANGSTQFRLKCIASDDKQALESLSLSDLCVQPGRWPRHLSVSINGDMGVDFRRKVHHGADLPTDVTDLLVDGVNEVTVCVSFTPSEAPTAYMMAIEVTSMADEEKVRSMTGEISAEEVSASIDAALNGNNTINADEDLVISQPNISIDLVDPFMSTMWNTPVRGKMCHHRECFDLDAFLDSRTNHDGVTSPDQWKCPICRNDARPQMLVLDHFLANVRTTLGGMNRLDAKAILVNGDGTWEVKPEPLGKSDRSTKHMTVKRETHANTPKTDEEVSTVPQAENSVETPPSDTVIALDDD